MGRLSNLITQILKIKEHFQAGVGRKCDNRSRVRCTFVALKVGNGATERGPRAKECGRPLERGRDKEMDCARSGQEEPTLGTADFAQRDRCWASDL